MRPKKVHSSNPALAGEIFGAGGTATFDEGGTARIGAVS